MLLASKAGVKSKKPRRCTLCGERIHIGEAHNTRTGVDSGDVWTMRMHPECERYESVPGVVDVEWYEDVSAPAFERGDAHRSEELQLNPEPSCDPSCGAYKCIVCPL